MRGNNELEIILETETAISHAREISDAALGSRPIWPDLRPPAAETAPQNLSKITSQFLLRAIDRAARGETKVSPPARGWAMYMLNHHGRPPSGPTV